MKNKEYVMPNVITVVTNPAEQPLDERVLNRLFQAMERKGAVVESLNWLAPDAACDVLFTDLAVADATEAVRNSKFAAEKVDWIVQPRERRRKKLLICDMDSTIIQQECIDELAATLGLKEKVSAITERAMNGELDFAAALKERVALLKGLPEETLQEVYNNQITFMPGAKELVATMNNHGAHTMLVSGGFTFFTQRVAKALGFAETHANILTITGGKLAGTVHEPILDKHSKLQSLEDARAKLRLAADDVMAAGDGANDLPMLLAAGVGVAYHAKLSVRQAAHYSVNYTDLTSLLYFQGYAKQDFSYA